MALGAPVAASNTASLPEILGGAALYFNPYDANDMAEKMYEILTNGILRDDLIQRGYKQARKYDWRDMAMKTLALYNSINS
jgi:glycosyltransferase involved in cell wall biosynthesis